jgi:IPT/TIG domain
MLGLSSQPAQAEFLQATPKLTDEGQIGDGKFRQSEALDAKGDKAVVGGPQDNGGNGAFWWTTSPGSNFPAIAVTEGGQTALISSPDDNGGWLYSQLSSGPPPPTVTTEPASDVGQTTATLNGTVNPNGGTIESCDFQLAEPGGPKDVACATGQSGTSSVPVSVQVSGLETPGAHYEFTLEVCTAGGCTTGATLGFTALEYAKVDSAGPVNGEVEVINEDGTTARSVSASSVPQPPAGTAVIGGLSYEITGVTVCGETKVTLKLPSGSNPSRIYKYVSGFEEIPTPTAQISGNEVTLTLTDGGQFDADHTCNGVIVDPVVPVHEEPPGVTALSSQEGREAGGTAVTITGANFSEGATVHFGSGSATGVTVNSSTSITATAPAGTGTVDVTVTTPGGTSTTGAADRFTYVPVPTVTKLKPLSGPVDGGRTVTITGTSLSHASAVKFGTVAAASFTVNSSTSIAAVTPAEPAGNVAVTVMTPGGTSAVVRNTIYKFTPTVTGVSPNGGPTTGGTHITITGTGFAVGSAGTVLKLGTTKAMSVNCISSTECTAVSPAHAAGIVDVRATVNKVSSPKNAPADQFTYS